MEIKSNDELDHSNWINPVIWQLIRVLTYYHITPEGGRDTVGHPSHPCVIKPALGVKSTAAQHKVVSPTSGGGGPTREELGAFFKQPNIVVEVADLLLQILHALLLVGAC